MKKLLVVSLMWFFLQGSNLLAQQLPLFNQNQLSSALDNPATISSSYFKYYTPTSISFCYRSQWVKVKDAPRTYAGSLSHFNEDNSLLFGGNIVSDQTGVISYNGLYGKIGYGIEFSKDCLLSIGITGGMVQYRVKADQLQFLESGDIASENQTKLYPDFGIGAMIYLGEKYFAGISIPQTFGLNLLFKENNNDFSLERVQHYQGVVGAMIELGGGSWFEPSAEVRYVNAVPLHVLARLRYEYQQLFWLSFGAASTKEVNAEVGLMIDFGRRNDLMSFSYSFSNYFQNYGPVFGSAHEIGVNILLGN